MIQVSWHKAETNIVVWKFITPWTFDEFYAAQKQVDAMIDTVEGRVDSIFLTTIEHRLPINSLTHIRKIVAQQHPRHRYMVIVTTQPFLAVLLKIITELVPDFKSNLNYARTFADAHTLIRRKRNELLVVI